MSKKLQISQLQATGGLVSEKPVEKEIEWYDIIDGKRVPGVFTVHVLRLSFKRIEDIAKNAKSITVSLIAEGILFDGGETKLTQAQADALDPELTNKLIQLFNEVNGTKAGDAGK